MRLHGPEQGSTPKTRPTHYLHPLADRPFTVVLWVLQTGDSQQQGGIRAALELPAQDSTFPGTEANSRRHPLQRAEHLCLCLVLQSREGCPNWGIGTQESRQTGGLGTHQPLNLHRNLVARASSWVGRSWASRLTSLGCLFQV